MAMLLGTVVKRTFGLLVEGMKGVGNCFMLPISVGGAVGSAVSPISAPHHGGESYYVGDESGESLPGERLLPD